MRIGSFGFVAAVLLWWTPANVMARDYVVNGGFEVGGTSGVLATSFSSDIIYVFGVGGATNIGGWTVSNSSNSTGPTPLSVLVTGSPPQVPASGSYALDFDPFWNITTGALLSSNGQGMVTGTLPQISQVIDLPAGQFVLSFDAAIEQDGGSGTRSALVTLTGAASLSQTPTTSLPDSNGYDHFSYDFSSSGGDVTLTFTPNDYTPEPNFMLDNVSITSTAPEPSSMALLTMGALAIVLCQRRNVVLKVISSCLPLSRLDIPATRRGALPGAFD